MENIISASLLVHFASFLYVIAFIVRNQLILRGLVLVATVMYIAYYFFVPAVPLWDAIGWSVILGGANIYIMTQLILERTTFRMTEEEKKLYRVFDTLNPGEYRRFLKITQWHKCGPGETHKLTTEGDMCRYLYFVLSGDIQIQKGERQFNIPSEKFIGEVSYYLHEPASATVTVTGADYVRWEHDALENLKKMNPSIRVAVQQILNTDMAHKIAVS